MLKKTKVGSLFASLAIACLLLLSNTPSSSAHTVSTTSGSCWSYLGSHNPSTSATFKYDASVTSTYKTANANGADMWKTATGNKLTATLNTSSPNTILEYWGTLSGYYAYHTVTGENGEHQTSWQIDYNAYKMQNFGSFRDTIAAHEWGHVWGLDESSCGQVLMYSRIGDGGGTATSPTSSDVAGVKAIYGF
ncbi:matrixin family metalloprotease [Brevibacillus agri]|uniref:matrixin family metalloprotease n=1 Tax=Brevibacillus agri TaxID=51101 RepID=UPI0012FD7DB8|nr:matrixin family metalloprotease [Brevibacillus agri]MDN4096210.1 matrixin family metalloprotease [Brevibacillus agri]MDR9507170.1 matrixin family metalloprotease [Brevibacillus agri]MED3498478.1 matrixin family metalloprotease [Brevibacillus agri]